MENQVVPYKNLCKKEKKVIAKRKVRIRLLEKLKAPSKLFHIDFNHHMENVDFDRLQELRQDYCSYFTDPITGEKELIRRTGFKICNSYPVEVNENWSLPESETDYLEELGDLLQEAVWSFFAIERIIKEYGLNQVALETENILNNCSLELRIHHSKASHFRDDFYRHGKVCERRDIDNRNKVIAANLRVKPLYDACAQIVQPIIELKKALEEYEEALVATREEDYLRHAKLSVLKQHSDHKSSWLTTVATSINGVVASVK